MKKVQVPLTEKPTFGVVFSGPTLGLAEDTGTEVGNETVNQVCKQYAEFLAEVGVSASSASTKKNFKVVPEQIQLIESILPDASIDDVNMSGFVNQAYMFAALKQRMENVSN